MSRDKVIRKALATARNGFAIGGFSPFVAPVFRPVGMPTIQPSAMTPVRPAAVSPPVSPATMPTAPVAPSAPAFDPGQFAHGRWRTASPFARPAALAAEGIGGGGGSGGDAGGSASGAGASSDAIGDTTSGNYGGQFAGAPGLMGIGQSMAAGQAPGVGQVAGALAGLATGPAGLAVGALGTGLNALGFSPSQDPHGTGGGGGMGADKGADKAGDDSGGGMGAAGSSEHGAEKGGAGDEGGAGGSPGGGGDDGGDGGGGSGSGDSSGEKAAGGAVDPAMNALETLAAHGFDPSGSKDDAQTFRHRDTGHEVMIIPTWHGDGNHAALYNPKATAPIATGRGKDPQAAVSMMLEAAKRNGRMADDGTVGPSKYRVAGKNPKTGAKIWRPKADGGGVSRALAIAHAAQQKGARHG